MKEDEMQLENQTVYYSRKSKIIQEQRITVKIKEFILDGDWLVDHRWTEKGV